MQSDIFITSSPRPLYRGERGKHRGMAWRGRAW
nr:MAG TPA: hypothetical protein [Caudoviricetes sp.]